MASCRVIGRGRRGLEVFGVPFLVAAPGIYDWRLKKGIKRKGAKGQRRKV